MAIIKEKSTAFIIISGDTWTIKDWLSLVDIKTLLETYGMHFNANESVIVAIDGGELFGKGPDEIKEDILISQIPDHNHMVVVLSINAKNKTITTYDSNSSNTEDT